MRYKVHYDTFKATREGEMKVHKSGTFEANEDTSVYVIPSFNFNDIDDFQSIKVNDLIDYDGAIMVRGYISVADDTMNFNIIHKVEVINEVLTEGKKLHWWQEENVNDFANHIKSSQANREDFENELYGKFR